MRSSRVALVQMQCGTEPEKNFAKAIARIRDAAKQGAQIVCLPELFRSQYFCQSEDHANFALAEEIPGPTTDCVGQTRARDSGSSSSPRFSRSARPAFITTPLRSSTPMGNFSGSIARCTSRTIRLYYEKFYFTPGDLGFQAWPTLAGKHRRLRLLGSMVSGSGAPDRVARRARFLFYPTAIGWHPAEKEKYGAAQHSAWETMQRSHAIANGCFVAAVNRVGHEAPTGGAGIEFWGQSFIVAPERRNHREGQASIRKKSLSRISTGSESMNIERTGRFCAIAASMRMPTSNSA